MAAVLSAAASGWACDCYGCDALTVAALAVAGLMGELLDASEQYLTEKLKRHVKLVVERSADPTISFVRGTFDRQAAASPSPTGG